jgi:hypothetical protein
LALGAIPAVAQMNWTYDNGPLNGTLDAYTINFGFTVSDSYVAGGTSVTGYSFYAWEFGGDTVTSSSWSITSGENSGTTFGSGTASGKTLTDLFISSNQYNYDIDLITVTGLNVPELSGTTYWLNLNNTVSKLGDPVYWDENQGVGCGGQGCPSLASQTSTGTIPSESFTISGGTTVPEPSSIMLFGSGVLGLAGLLRRKLF